MDTGQQEKPLPGEGESRGEGSIPGDSSGGVTGRVTRKMRTRETMSRSGSLELTSSGNTGREKLRLWAAPRPSYAAAFSS